MTTFLRRQLRPAIAVLALLTLLTGVAYPAAVTAIAQLAFPNQANGSLIVVDGQTVGSDADRPVLLRDRSTSGVACRPLEPTATTATPPAAPTWARPTRT